MIQYSSRILQEKECYDEEVQADQETDHKPDGEIWWLVDQKRDDQTPPTDKGQGSG